MAIEFSNHTAKQFEKNIISRFKNKIHSIRKYYEQDPKSHEITINTNCKESDENYA